MKGISATSYYYLSFLLIPVLGLFQTKILTTLLTPKAFGAIQLILPLLAWMVLIGGMGTPQYVIRFYSRDGIRAYEEGLFLSVANIFVVGLSICTILYCFTTSYENLNISGRLVSIFLLATVTLQIVALVQSLVRVQKRHVFYNAVAICAKIFLVVGVVIGVVLWSESPAEGYLLGTAIASMAMLLLVIILFRMKYILKANKPSWNSTRQLIIYGLPIVFIMLMGELLPSLNRYVIAAKLDTSAVAKYTIGCMIAGLCFQTLYEPLNTILHPPAFEAWEKNHKNGTRRLITEYLNIYIFIGVILCGLTIRFEDILLNIVANSNYRMPTGCFSVLILSNFLLGIYRFMSIHYYLERNTIELGMCFFLSISVSFSAALLLIGRIGLLGATLSVFLGVAILTTVVWIRAQRNLGIRLLPRYYINAFILCLFLIFVPILSVWDIYSPLRWLDAGLSFGISVIASCVLIKIFNKSVNSSFS